MNGDMNQQQPAGTSQSKMWFAVVVVLLIVAIFGGFYWFGYFKLPGLPLSPGAESGLLEIENIELELEAVGLEGLDQELSDIEAELNAAQ